ncbi:MAG TPA: LPS export ABC transporter periplasmic protein LptC [Burkholderiales bacterium]|nr:LPS export ABC transporter periplasmic protein LptC [Burkholderiales bacterium]
MRLAATRLFPLLLMLSLAAITFWLQQTVRQEQGTPPAPLRHDPDYIIDNLHTVRYDRRGAVESTLDAAKMIHYPDDDSTDLVTPRMVQTKPGEPRTTVTAERGTLSQDGEEMFLYDNVLVVRDASGERPEMRMRTSFLHLVRDRSVIESDREVTITEGSRMLRGRGMEYHNDTGQLFLRHNVHGRYEPNPSAAAEEP